MQGQAELAKRTLDAGAGLQVHPAQIRLVVNEFFNDMKKEETMRKRAHELIQSGRGSALQTLNVLLGV